MALAYWQAANLHAVPPGTTVIFENAVNFLYVTRDCTYWARDLVNPFWELIEARTGVLSETQLDELTRRLELEVLAARAGVHRVSERVYDATDVVLNVSGVEVRCEAGCARPGPSQEVVRLFESAQAVLSDLYAGGIAATGDVRVAVVPFDESITKYISWNTGPVEWPLAAPLDRFVSPFKVLAPWTGHLVSLPEAAVLRELRQRQSRGEMADRKDTAVAVPIGKDRQGPIYGLYVRDVLPIEDASGRVKIGP